MRQFAQLDTGCPSKFGVQAKYVDRELHLVDDALAGAVPAAEQFEVFDSVIASNSVDVMNGFFVAQFSANMSGHHVTMFENAVFGAGDQRWNGNPHVAVPFNVSLEIAFFKTCKGLFSWRFVSAFLTAVFLCAINAGSCFTAALNKRPLAIFANAHVSLVSLFSSVFSKAHAGAVWRVFSVFLSVGSQVGRFVKEWLLTVLATEFGNWRGWATNHDNTSCAMAGAR